MLGRITTEAFSLLSDNQESDLPTSTVDEIVSKVFGTSGSEQAITFNPPKLLQSYQQECRLLFETILALLNKHRNSDKIRKENEFLQSNLEQLEQSLSEAVDFIEDIQRTLETINRENVTLSTQLITKKQSFENLKENSKEVANMLKEKINYLQDKIDSLTRQNEYLSGMLLKIDACYLRESLDTNNFSSAFNPTEKITVTNLNQRSVEGDMQTINSIQQMQIEATITNQVQSKTKTIPEMDDQKPWF